VTQVQADVSAMKADAHEANARRPAILGLSATSSPAQPASAREALGNSAQLCDAVMAGNVRARFDQPSVYSNR
jgi:hypothetical protein